MKKQIPLEIGYAREYERVIGNYPIHGYAAEYLVEISNISGDSTVLDLGAGTGLVSSEALKYHPERIILLDKSQTMLNVAKEKLGSLVEYVCADASDLLSHVGEGSVDAVIANYALHWFDDPQTVLENVKDVLRLGGVFCTDAYDQRMGCYASTPVHMEFVRNFRRIYQKRRGTRTPSAFDISSYPLVGFEMEEFFADFEIDPDDMDLIWRYGTKLNFLGTGYFLDRELDRSISHAIEKTKRSEAYKQWVLNEEPLVEYFRFLRLTKK